MLVTGGAKGIGAQISRSFARQGYNVIVNYYSSREQAEELVSELSGHDCQSISIQADISNINQVKNMIQRAECLFGHIDILVNNAGIAQQKLFTDISEKEWDAMFDVNVKGAFNCIQAVLPKMINSKRGKIINISSIWGMVGASCEVHYSASKAAIIGFTKALAKELGPSNIQVNCVAPGVILTDMTSDLGEDTLEGLKQETPLGTIGKPLDIASAVLFLASEGADFITGQVISPNGGFLI